MTNSRSLHVVLDSKIAHGLLLAGRFSDGYNTAQEAHIAFLTLHKEEIDWQAKRADNWLLQRLCEYNRWSGNYDEAERYGYDAVEMFSGNSKETAWDIGWSKYHLAYALLFQRKIEECKKHLEEAIKLFKDVGSKYSTAFAMELLGQAYMLEGDYTTALALTISAGDTISKILAPEHPDCGRNWMCKGNIHRQAGNEQEAVRCYTKSATAFRGKHDLKAKLMTELLKSNEIILDIWGKTFQLDNDMHS